MNDLINIIADWERRRQAQKILNDRNKGMVFDALSAAGITDIRVDFDGEGDSGQINNITALKGEDVVSLPRALIAMQTAGGGDDVVTREAFLEEAIELLCYLYLEQTHDGWENNDGGFGDFRFVVATRTIELEFNGRITETFTATHEF